MNVKEQVLKQLENNKGQYISGGDLSKELSVSRNAIWKAIQSLIKDGYLIESTPRKGYLLKEDSDILSAQSIEKYLKSDLEVTVIPTCTSTNLELVEMANNGAKHGTVLVSTEQTTGKGRTGKSFYSPKDTGVYISILLRPDIPATESLFFTTSAAVATAKAIEDVSDRKAQIKWVNDVYIEDKKVCGILTEASLNIETNKLDYAVVGIGINLIPPKGGFPKDIKKIATTVFENKADSKNKTSILVAHLLDYYMEYYNSFDSNSHLKEYINRSNMIGKQITIYKGDQIIKARAIDIDSKCRLKIEDEDGNTSLLSYGEVSIDF